jgi:hypothetical protein
MNMVATGLRNSEGSLLQKLCDYYRSPVVLERDRATGAFGWLAILLFVIAYDFYAIRTRRIETLTRFFWRSTEKNITTSIPLIGVWIILSFHLLIEKPLRQILTRGLHGQI